VACGAFPRPVPAAARQAASPAALPQARTLEQDVVDALRRILPRVHTIGPLLTFASAMPVQHSCDLRQPLEGGPELPPVAGRPGGRLDRVRQLGRADDQLAISISEFRVKMQACLSVFSGRPAACSFTMSNKTEVESFYSS
jgi:hypothetical protein